MCSHKDFVDLETHRETRIEACDRFLEDHRDILADNLAPLRRRKGLEIATLEFHLVGGDRRRIGQKPHDGQHGDRFAGAAFADDRQHFAGVDRVVDAVQRPERTGGCVEFDFQVANFKQWHRLSSASVSGRARRATRRRRD